MLRETLWWPWSERKNAPLAPADEAVTPPNGPPDTKEVEALADSLNHSAERVQTLWLSFLTFTLYLAIAAGTTTHPMLFREDPLKLPVLNIDLPLIGFYVLAPLIFVVFHFYMLLNLVLLARTARIFDDALGRAPLADDVRENFRMRIENTLFVQLLVGGRRERKGFNSWLLSLMALITLALAPVFIQIRFLPYHSEGITWWHRGLLALDLLLVGTLWPGFRSGWGVRLWPRTIWASALLLVWIAGALFYALAVANFPDERLYVATKGLREGLDIAWLWPRNTLDLRNRNLIDDAKLKQIKEREAAGSETKASSANN